MTNKIEGYDVTLGIQVFVPSAVTNITAGGGITPVSTFMRIQGDGGAVDITANPQISAGAYGQLLIVEGESDVNTVLLENGDGMRLRGGRKVLHEHDYVGLIYDDDSNEWVQVFSNVEADTAAWAFTSPSGSSGTFYWGGHYDLAGTDNDFNPAVNFGTANKAEGAHFFLVQAAGGAGGTDTVIRVTGTSMTDNGVRQAGDTEDIIVDDAGAANTYYETSKKWIGQISVEKQSGPDLLCNYGFVKYWDNNNTDFRLLGFEATWLSGATDAGVNISIIHHKATGWTYNNGAAATPPAAVYDMQTDYNTEYSTINGENGSWKRDNLDVVVNGGDGEGIILEVLTTANKTFELGNMTLRTRAT